MSLFVLAQTAPATHSTLYYHLISMLYGVVEGLTEFLPISSTAHLRLVEALTPGISLQSGYWKMYSVAIQLGAILSVPLLFRERIMRFVQTFPRGEARNKNWLTHPLSLVLIGFLVTAGPCYLADKKIGEHLENMFFIGGALLIGGVVMWVVDGLFTRPKTQRVEEMSVLDAIWIGAVQVLSAMFPGTSRSMVTIAGGQIFGLSRSVALEYSFFLSIPTMLAATGYKLLQAVVHRPQTAEEIAAYQAPPGQWTVLAVGFAVSFVVALVVNWWFINWVRRRGFAPFAIYRIVLGAAVLAGHLG